MCFMLVSRPDWVFHGRLREERMQLKNEGSFMHRSSTG
jgi:hypothetical protein